MIAALKATELEAKRPKGPRESSCCSSCKSSLNKWIALCQEAAVEHALMAALYVTTVAIMFKDLRGRAANVKRFIFVFCCDMVFDSLMVVQGLFGTRTR